jgi:hypothetical protein
MRVMISILELVEVIMVIHTINHHKTIVVAILLQL